MLKFLCDMNLHFYLRLYLSANKKKYLHSEIIEKWIISASNRENHMIVNIMLPYLSDEQYKNVCGSLINHAFLYTSNNSQAIMMEANPRFYTIHNPNYSLDILFRDLCKYNNDYHNKDYLINLLMDNIELDKDIIFECINHSISNGNLEILKKLVKKCNYGINFDDYNIGICITSWKDAKYLKKRKKKKVIEYVIKEVNDDLGMIKIFKSYSVDYREWF